MESLLIKTALRCPLDDEAFWSSIEIFPASPILKPIVLCLVTSNDAQWEARRLRKTLDQDISDPGGISISSRVSVEPGDVLTELIQDPPETEVSTVVKFVRSASIECSFLKLESGMMFEWIGLRSPLDRLQLYNNLRDELECIYARKIQSLTESSKRTISIKLEEEIFKVLEVPLIHHLHFPCRLEFQAMICDLFDLAVVYESTSSPSTDRIPNFGDSFVTQLVFQSPRIRPLLTKGSSANQFRTFFSPEEQAVWSFYKSNTPHLLHPTIFIRTALLLVRSGHLFIKNSFPTKCLANRKIIHEFVESDRGTIREGHKDKHYFVKRFILEKDLKLSKAINFDLPGHISYITSLDVERRFQIA